MESLSAMQRDMLYIVACSSPVTATTIRSELEAYYETSVTDGSLYPNLRRLHDGGFVEKHGSNGRDIKYELTNKGVVAIAGRAEWLATHLDDVDVAQ